MIIIHTSQLCNVVLEGSSSVVFVRVATPLLLFDIIATLSYRPLLIYTPSLHGGLKMFPPVYTALIRQSCFLCLVDRPDNWLTLD